LQLLSRVYEDPNRGKTDEKGKAKMAPPTMVRVLDLSDGRELDLMLSTIPLMRIQDAFPDDTHMGECVRLVKGDPVAGKRYTAFEVDVIDGTGSPHYRQPKDVIKNADKYGPSEKKAAKAR
jgi:hypothetical protein